MSALADTQSPLLFGLMAIEAFVGKYASAWLLLSCAAAMIVAFVGLYRLKVWGLIPNVVANVVIAVLAMGHVLGIPPLLRILFVSTAVLQLIVPIPTLFTVHTQLPFPLRLGPHKRRIASLEVVSVLMMLSLSCFLSGARLLRL